MDSSPSTYRSIQKWLHWLTASGVILQYAMFDGMGRPFGEGVEANQMPYTVTTISHIAIGTTILLLTILRMILRLRFGAPTPHEAEPSWAVIGAHLAHGALYALILLLPLSGLLAWFLPSETLAEWHAIGATLLIWLIFAHVFAVAVHQVWWRTDILRRMT